jgi:formylglycine-generating enzyme
MKYIPQVCVLLLLIICFSCTDGGNVNQVLVEGGELKSKDSLTATKKIMIADFYISATEITQKEWLAVMGANPSEFQGENVPITNVTWYDCITYCNKKSESEGLSLYYDINKTLADTSVQDSSDHLRWTIKPNKTANGYRLPTVYEWEYAASGGKLTKDYTYSGSHDLHEVAWYWHNSGRQLLSGIWSYKTVIHNNCKPHEVSLKIPNELGLYDMSGNVREWCWDFQNNGFGDTGRAWKGGGWAGGDYVCEPVFTRYHSGIVPSNDLGFRIVRNK